MHKASYIELATKLRKQGYSFTMIQERVPVAKSTLSRWLKDVPFTANKQVQQRIGYALSKAIEAKQNIKQASYAHASALAQKDLDTNRSSTLLYLGLGLYMGEGEKNNNVGLANSDAEIIRLFITWLHRCYGVTHKYLTISVHLYEDTDIEAAKSYWSHITGISLQQFGKTQIDTRKKISSMKRGKLPHGTAHVRVKSNGKKEFGVLLSRRIEESIRLLPQTMRV